MHNSDKGKLPEIENARNLAWVIHAERAKFSTAHVRSSGTFTCQMDQLIMIRIIILVLGFRVLIVPY